MLWVALVPAQGNSNIPTERRFYLQFEFPNESFGRKLSLKPRSLWLDERWTIGKVLDEVCKVANGLENRNHLGTGETLSLQGKANDLKLPFDVPLKLLDPQLKSGDTVQAVYC